MRFLERPASALTANSKRALFLGKLEEEIGFALRGDLHSPHTVILFPQHHFAFTSRTSPQQHNTSSAPLHHKSQPPWCASNSATSS